MRRHDAIKKAVQSLLDGLNLPDGDRSLETLVRAAERDYGKPIRIRPLSSPDQHHTGYWIDHEDHGTILYRQTDSDSMQLQTVLHELMHVIAGHGGCAAKPESARTFRSMLGDRIISIRARSIGSGSSLDGTQQDEEAVAERGAFSLAEWLRGVGSEAAGEFF